MDTGGPEPKLEQTADVSAGQNDETLQSDDAVEEVESTGGKEEADSLLGVEESEPKSEEAVVLSAGQQEETLLSGEEEEADATAEKESDAAQEVIIDGSKSGDEENDEDGACDEVVKMSDTSQEEVPQSEDAVEETEAAAEKELSLGSKLGDELTKDDAAGDAVNQSEGNRPIFVLPQAMDEDDEDNAAIERLLMRFDQSKSSATATAARRSSNLQRLPCAEKDFTEDEKKKPRFRWYHAIFLFSIASLIVCLLQLFTAPPFGVWMTSAEIEEIGIAPEGGCEDGLEHCICP
mmetsp:Transcript_27985/g.47398  ORF Transcript_27985/g.47398 Transcript_27985/m.47398 type:complete len:292 (-) Transcript_27985:795-1670(-)